MFTVDSFFQAVLNFIVDIFFFIARIINVAIFSPILAIFSTIFPNINLVENISAFLERIIVGIGFAKETFLNLTGFPRPLFTAFVTFFFARFFLTSTIRTYLFILRMYRLIKKGD